MSDIIRRSDAIEVWYKLSKRGRTEFDQVLMMLPSAEPTHGKWEEIEKSEHGGLSIVSMRCNQCGRYTYLVLPKGTKCVYDYCPNCGSKMNKEENNE